RQPGERHGDGLVLEIPKRLPDCRAVAEAAIGHPERRGGIETERATRRDGGSLIGALQAQRSTTCARWHPYLQRTQTRAAPAVISPIAAARSNPSCANTASTSSTACGAQATSK